MTGEFSASCLNYIRVHYDLNYVVSAYEACCCNFDLDVIFALDVST